MTQANTVTITPLEAPQNGDPILQSLNAQVWRFRVTYPPAADELGGHDAPLLSLDTMIPTGEVTPSLREPIVAEEIVVTVLPTDRTLDKSLQWIVSIVQPRAKTQSCGARDESLFYAIGLDWARRNSAAIGKMAHGRF